MSDQEKLHSLKKVHLVSLIPLLAILTNEACKLGFFIHLRKVNGVSSLITIWIFLQVVFSPILGLISDKFCRKKILVVTLLATSTAFFLLSKGLYLPAIIIDGSLGVVTPIARAAYCDVHISSQRQPNIINTFIAQPISWIVFTILFSGSNLFWPIFAFGLLISLLAILAFRDPRDEDEKKISFRFEGIKANYGWVLSIRVLFSFVLLNTVWNMFQYFFEEGAEVAKFSDFLWINLGVAFLLGTLVARYVKIKAKKILSFAFILTFLCSSLFFLQWRFLINTEEIVPIMFLIFTFLGGIIMPLTYAFFGEKVELHEQGVLYGLLDSVQSGTELLGPVLLVTAILSAVITSNLIYLLIITSFVSVVLTGSLVIKRK